MTNQVIPTELFETKFKRLKKKFRSLAEDLAELTEILEHNPATGESLGAGLYKVRLGSKSKGKGKRGGFRIITYLITETLEGTDIYLITIYDKSEENNIRKEELLHIVKALFG